MELPTLGRLATGVLQAVRGRLFTGGTVIPQYGVITVTTRTHTFESSRMESDITIETRRHIVEVT